MDLPRYETFFAFSPRGPARPTRPSLARVEKMIADLEALRTAPLVDPYTGPAILSGRAGGVFFHEIFGHRIEGHRQKKAEEGQTFKKKLGRDDPPGDVQGLLRSDLRPRRRKTEPGRLLPVRRRRGEGAPRRPGGGGSPEGLPDGADAHRGLPRVQRPRPQAGRAAPPVSRQANLDRRGRRSRCLARR